MSPSTFCYAFAYAFVLLFSTSIDKFQQQQRGKSRLNKSTFLLLILQFLSTCTFCYTLTFGELFISYCYCFYFSRPFSLLCLFYYLLLARLRGKLTNIPNWSMAGSASQLIADFCFRISIRKTTILKAKKIHYVGINVKYSLENVFISVDNLTVSGVSFFCLILLNSL